MNTSETLSNSTKTELAGYFPLTKQYSVSGKVRDVRGNGVSNLLVEAYDHHFGIASDFVGSSFTDSFGKFVIAFQTLDFKPGFDIFETKPNLYVVIRDEYRAVYTSETRKEAGLDDLFFDITLPSITSDTYSEPFDDPYSDNTQIMISEFSAVGDSVAPEDVNLLRTVPQLLRSINSFIHYSDPRVTKIYGYPGPQLPARPKESEPHTHYIPWTADRWSKAGITVPDSFWQYPPVTSSLSFKPPDYSSTSSSWG